MPLKKLKITKKPHFKYFIKYNSFNIYKIWNTNKHKIIKTKDIIINKNLRYDSTNIDLNQLINKPFIEIDLFESIQSNFIKIIEINSNKNLKLSLNSTKLNKLFNLHIINSLDF